MVEYDIEANDVLTKVSRYELDRGDRIIIDIHEIFSAEQKGKYFAVPHLILNQAKDEYLAYGETEDEALRKCLKLIKGKKIEEILDLAKSE